MKNKIFAILLVCIMVISSAPICAFTTFAANNDFIMSAYDANGDDVGITLSETESIAQSKLIDAGLEDYEVAFCADIKINQDVSQLNWPVTLTIKKDYEKIMLFENDKFNNIGLGNRAVLYSKPDEDSFLVVLDKKVKYNTGDDSGVGSVLSGGNLWIIFSVAVVALTGVTAVLVVRKKKNSATNTSDTPKF